MTDTKETKLRGTRDFPIDYHYVDWRHSRYQMASHWHFELEMIRLLSGTFDLYLDDELFRLEAGDLAFVDAGTLHGGRVGGGGAYECLVFDPELIRHRNYRDDVFVRRLLHHHMSLKKVYRADEISSDETLSFAVRSMFSSMKDEAPGYEQVLTSSLRLFFSSCEKYGWYEENAFAEKNGRERIEQIKAVLEHIEEHYAEEMTLDELASIAGLSKRYFCSFFKELTGRKCFEYIRLVRMENAAIMLRAGEKTVSETAYAVGYEDTSYFTRIFRSTMGMSPREYRKNPAPRDE